MELHTTIAAISTPMAPGGIGIVRISGPEAVAVADRIFRSAKGKTLSQRPTHTLTYGEIFDPATGEAVDECLASVMRGPHTYTGEDICEINCHGGLYVCDRVLRLCLEYGASLAQPGEFTKRAFLNGKMDLSRAEAVIDLISAESGAANRVAVGQLKGQMGRRIQSLREAIIRVCADILVEVEYPEDDAPAIQEQETYITICKIRDKISKLYHSFEAGRAIKEGIQTVIVGKPNVGKSSILNVLAGVDRAIVTSIAGTTRDVLQERIRLGGVMLNVHDTAGIRHAQDEVERIGVERSLELINQGELIFFVVDISRPLDENDEAIMAQLDPARTIVLFNKTDLQTTVDEARILAQFPHTVYLSALRNTGVESLEQMVREMFLQKAQGLEQGEIVTNARQRDCLRRACEDVQRAVDGLDAGYPFDLVTIDLQDAVDDLGQITGQTASEEIIADIFSRFCLGK